MSSSVSPVEHRFNDPNDGTSNRITGDATIMDSPCWGSPQQCDLKHFLSQFPDNQRVLFDSESYVVVNKPPDLRMDGPQLSTVHKWLTFLYPTPSLLQRAEVEAKQKMVPATRENETTEKETILEQHLQKYLKLLLLRQVGQLHKHNDLPDNFLRPCHQLDYATSGVLLVAKTKKAAGVACQSFAKRLAQKEYLAVVHGHVSTAALPLLPASVLHECGVLEEGRYQQQKRIRHKQNNTGNEHPTFAGYLPAHTIFQQWKARIKRRQQQQQQHEHEQLISNQSEETSTTFESEEVEKQQVAGVSQRRKYKRPKKTMHVNAFQKSSLDPNDDDVAMNLSPKEQEALLEMPWAKVKKEAKYQAVFKEMAKRSNEEKRQQLQVGCEAATPRSRCQNGKTITSSPASATTRAPPTLFRVEGEADNCFYIYAALAQVKDQFHMILNPEQIGQVHAQAPYLRKFFAPSGNTSRNNNDDNNDNDDKNKNTNNNINTDALDFKPALTRCIVHWRGQLSSQQPVTKVRLQPRTGRRHQLRLHMALAGHAIVGDVTYEDPSLAAASTRTSDESVNNSTNTVSSIVCDRMCLHAHTLTIPLLQQQNDTPPSSSSSSKSRGGSDNNSSFSFTAPDPFAIDNTELKVNF